MGKNRLELNVEGFTGDMGGCKVSEFRWMNQNKSSQNHSSAISAHEIAAVNPQCEGKTFSMAAFSSVDSRLELIRAWLTDRKVPSLWSEICNISLPLLIVISPNPSNFSELTYRSQIKKLQLIVCRPVLHNHPQMCVWQAVGIDPKFGWFPTISPEKHIRMSG
jgi:hypothetical protein